jgi:thiol-disulfide isomerase/thioredoxin
VAGALVLAARLLLAAVLVVAAVAKLADREGSRRAAVDFGAPARLAGVLSLLLPFAELAVAALLLPASTALAGAVGALALLLLFSGAVALALSRGHEPECHCFGQLHSAPAGRSTLIRNAGLAAVAAFAVAGLLGGYDESATAWIGRLDGSETAVLAIGVAATILLLAGAIAYLRLLRAYGGVLLRLEELEGGRAPQPAFGLEPGTPAPAFTAADAAGAEVALEDLLAPGVPLLMLFASPACGPCAELMPQVTEWQSAHRDRLTVAVASEGTAEDVREEVEGLGLDHVLVDQDGELYRLFEANGTPSAVVVAPDGSMGSHVASGPGRITQLVAAILDVPGLPVGASVPSLELPSLEGETVNLREFGERDTLLLFWNPACGHCRAMHADVLTLEAGANGVTPRLVVVSSGDETSTRAEGFSSTVLLDRPGGAGTEFGVGGTPMAVLLGADGRVASGVAAGAQAVLGLWRDR